MLPHHSGYQVDENTELWSKIDVNNVSVIVTNFLPAGSCIKHVFIWYVTKNRL